MRTETIVRWTKGPDVLDVGCTGHNLTVKNRSVVETPDWIHGALRRRFPIVWGIDIEESNIEALQDMGFDNLFVADAQDFSLNKTFDTIVAGEVIEHLENPGSFLSCAARHLKEDGRIVITTPYPFGVPETAYALKNFPRTCQNPQHTMWFCPSTLSTLAERVGLRVKHWEAGPGIVPNTDSRAWNWLIRGTRVLPRRLKSTHMLFVLTHS